MSTTAESISPQKNTSGDWNAVLEEMKKQLISLEQERAVIQRRIVVVKQTIQGLVTVFGRSVICDDLRDLIRDSKRSRCEQGLTRTCAQLLAESSRALTVAELVTIIRDRYPSLFAYNNCPTSSLSTVLGRLSRYGTVQPVLNERGARAWRSAPQLATADPSLPSPEVSATNTTPTDSGTQRETVGPYIPVTSELTRACRIALLESQELASPEEIHARILRRASFSFVGIERPLAAIARALEILAEEGPNQNPS